MLKKLTVSPTQPQRAETRLSPVKAAVSERPRRIHFTPARPELLWQLLRGGTLSSERFENEAGELLQHPQATYSVFQTPKPSVRTAVGSRHSAIAPDPEIHPSHEAKAKHDASKHKP